MEELVFVGDDGIVMTDSLKIAEGFCKAHKHVLKSLRSLRAEKMAGVIIKDSTYKDKNGQMRPKYLMNRKAFSMLVFGFNGKEALDFKSRYIDAFDAMEKHIREDEKPNSAVQLPSSPLDMLKLIVSQLDESDRKVKELEQKVSEQSEQITATSEKVEQIVKDKEEAIEELQKVELSDVEVSEATTRQKIVMVINTICKAYDIPQQELYKRLYKEFYAIDHHLLYSDCGEITDKKKSESALAYAERKGLIEQLWNRLCAIIRRNKWVVR